MTVAPDAPILFFDSGVGGLSILAPGFPRELVDDEPEEPGYEVFPPGRSS